MLSKQHKSQVLNDCSNRKKSKLDLLPLQDRTEKQQVPVDAKESTENMPVTSAVKSCVPSGQVFQFHGSHSITLNFNMSQ